MSTLELRSVSKSYGSVSALERVDLDVAVGSRTAIVGPSGSGKTTLLRLIAGFEVPDTGSIVLNSKTLANGAAFVPAHQRHIGYLPQDGALFPHMSVAKNIGFGLPRDLARDTERRDRRIAELMELVALDRTMLNRWPHELSGGQQQRVALARAMAQQPQLMLLDEPFSALDTGLRAATRKAVAQLLSDAGVTTILVTHDQAEALSFADQVAVMRDGRLVQVGSPEDVYLRPRDLATAEFLGDAIVLNATLNDGWAECALGRLAVDDATRNGPAQVMLRPEQLQLCGIDHGSAGIVTEIDFGGSTCMLTIRPDGASQTILVRCASMQMPPIGARVHLASIGTAHVLD